MTKKPNLVMNRAAVSVCIATYNGGKYIAEQISSILQQLNSYDEIVVVDDCSTDDTLEKIAAFDDARIKVFKNETNRSHVYSFGRVVSLATNDIIFMADQDDLWIDGRLALMTEKLLKSNSLLVSSNSTFIDTAGNGVDFYQDGVKAEDSVKTFKNILDIFLGKTNYYGCAMVLHKKLNNIILPIPGYVESHDLWIALAGNLMAKNLHLDDVTLARRIHGNNASILSRGIVKKIWSRVVFLISILHILLRMTKWEK